MDICGSFTLPNGKTIPVRCKLPEDLSLFSQDKIYTFKLELDKEDYQKRDCKIEELHKQGLSYAEIGKKYGISRQTVRSIIIKQHQKQYQKTRGLKYEINHTRPKRMYYLR